MIQLVRMKYPHFEFTCILRIKQLYLKIGYRTRGQHYNKFHIKLIPFFQPETMQLLKLHFSLSLDEKWCVFKCNWATSTYYVPSNFDWSAVKNAKTRTQKYYYNCFDIYHNPLFLRKNCTRQIRRNFPVEHVAGSRTTDSSFYKIFLINRAEQTKRIFQGNKIVCRSLYFDKQRGFGFIISAQKNSPLRNKVLRSPNNRFFLSVNCQRNNFAH